MPDPYKTSLTLDAVRRALALSDFDVMAAQLRMAPRPRPIRRGDLPGEPRRAAVLALLYPVNDVLHLVLMQRTESNGVHSGQVSFPGGRREEGETFEQAAIRETFEELGVADPIEIMGQLTLIYVPPSDFEINPFVGYLPVRPQWTPSPAEVAAVIETPLDFMFDDTCKGIESLTAPDGVTRQFPYYKIGDYKVWGATAAILSEFEERLRVVLELPHT